MSSMFQKLSTRFLASLLVALLAFSFALSPPVRAETSGQRSTRNIILAGVALATAIILYNNYHHKQVAHNTVVGHTADGGTVYADGRIVYPNGTVVYTSNNGRQPCSYDGYGIPCGSGARVYRVANDYDGDEQPVSYQPTYYRDADDRQVYYRDADDHPVYYRTRTYAPVSYAERNGERVYYRDADRDGSRGHGHHYGWAKHAHQNDGG